MDHTQPHFYKCVADDSDLDSVPALQAGQIRHHACDLREAGALVGPWLLMRRSDQRNDTVRFRQAIGPEICTESPAVSTATVTGMSLISNS